MTDKKKNKTIPQCVQPAVTGSAVFHGDCLEIMKTIPDGSIDMILCDLPYGTTECKWDVVIPFEPLWEQYERIIKQNGAIILTGASLFTIDLVNSNRKLFRYDLIWNKVGCSGFLNANKMPLRLHENISVFYKKLPVYNPQKTKGNPYVKKRNVKTVDVYAKFNPQTHNNSGDRHPTSIITIPRESATGANKERQLIAVHPTQKPVALFEYLIKTYSNEGETILDNCAGSGTTAIACINTNRNYILIEKEQKYFDVINERIEKHNQLRAGEFSF